MKPLVGERLQTLILRLARSRLTGTSAILLGLGAALAAGALRIAMQPFLEETVPFTTFYPALLIASVSGGVRGGLSALSGCLALGLVFIASPGGWGALSLEQVFALAALLFSGALTVALGWLVRRTLQDLEEARRREVLLSEELRHRVKNNLAVVQGIAHRTARSASGLPDFMEAYSHRLRGLSEVQDLIAASGEEATAIHAVVARALAPFDDRGGGVFQLSGPSDLRIAGSLATPLSLCLHELATNALKHGALTRPGGKVEISWEVTTHPAQARIEWRERGGPAVVPPTRRGLGVRLLERGLGNGPARLKYAEDGLQWSDTLELDQGSVRLGRSPDHQVRAGAGKGRAHTELGL